MVSALADKSRRRRASSWLLFPMFSSGRSFRVSEPYPAAPSSFQRNPMTAETEFLEGFTNSGRLYVPRFASSRANILPMRLTLFHKQARVLQSRATRSAPNHVLHAVGRRTGDKKLCTDIDSMLVKYSKRCDLVLGAVAYRRADRPLDVGWAGRQRAWTTVRWKVAPYRSLMAHGNRIMALLLNNLL
jgi:hypothetical protein